MGSGLSYPLGALLFAWGVDDRSLGPLDLVFPVERDGLGEQPLGCEGLGLYALDNALDDAGRKAGDANKLAKPGAAFASIAGYG